MYVRSPAPLATARAQIVQYDLKQIGINVQIQPFSPARDPSRLGEPFDIADRGCGDIAPYDDPYALLNLAFDGSLIHPGSGNTNLSYFNDPAYNRELEAAAAPDRCRSQSGVRETRQRARARRRAGGSLRDLQPHRVRRQPGSAA